MIHATGRPPESVAEAARIGEWEGGRVHSTSGPTREFGRRRHLRAVADWVSRAVCAVAVRPHEEVFMRHRYRLMIGVAVAALSSGCALQDSRYDNSRLAAGLGDYDESIIDWNFPTSTNQGLLLPPERLRPWRPAIGVPWATPSDTPPFRPNLAPAREGASAVYRWASPKIGRAHV